MLNQFLLLVLCSFWFQSFYPANGNAVEAVSSGVHAASGKEQNNPYAASLVQSPIPPKAGLLLLEVELTTEENEERRNPVSDFCKTFSGYPSDNEGVYNRYLKHQFLHLNSRVNNRPSIAFFILYHSWKSDLA